MKRSLLLVSLLLFSLPLMAEQPKNFSQAKRLMTRIYHDQTQTFYCGCQRQESKIQNQDCPFSSEEPMNLSWEHIVPASHMGRHLKEWKEGDPKCVTKNGKYYKGRRCANKVHPEYAKAAADPYNLVPAIRKLNMERKDHPFRLADSSFQGCALKVEKRTAYITSKIAGDIARIQLYMAETYPKLISLNPEKRKEYESWSQQDPAEIEGWECERVRRIERATGMVAPSLKQACKQKATKDRLTVVGK